MSEKIERMILCDGCCAERWEAVSRWVEEGAALTYSGALRFRAWCRACGAELPEGCRAVAVTVHHGRPGQTGWETEYLEPVGPGESGGEAA